MSDVTVYGSSDDLIEIEGAISEEFYAIRLNDENEDEGGLLAFSDGTLLRIVYDATGIWRITPILKGTAKLKIEQATDDDTNYSDRAVLSGADMRWVVLGKQFCRAASRSTGSNHD